MKLSARNKMPGTVTAIDKGAGNATVQIDLGGATLVTAMITNASVDGHPLSSRPPMAASPTS